MLHGCRQLVSCDVGLSPATSATLTFSCYHLVGHSKRTASDKLEEGGDDVKSSWPLRVGLHTCYNGTYNGKQRGDSKRLESSVRPDKTQVLHGCRQLVS